MAEAAKLLLSITMLLNDKSLIGQWAGGVDSVNQELCVPVLDIGGDWEANARLWAQQKLIVDDNYDKNKISENEASEKKEVNITG